MVSAVMHDAESKEQDCKEVRAALAGLWHQQVQAICSARRSHRSAHALCRSGGSALAGNAVHFDMVHKCNAVALAVSSVHALVLRSNYWSQSLKTCSLLAVKIVQPVDMSGFTFHSTCPMMECVCVE